MTSCFVPTPRKPNSKPKISILVINYKLPLRISYVGARGVEIPERVPVARKTKANQRYKKAANLQTQRVSVARKT